jgi:DNA mismatch endonuclease (patch repair protein)
MTDIFTPQQRSELMSRIRGRDTRPERIVRSMLHQLGYRFTVHGPGNRLLPGKPDIVLPRHHTVILVHGCFWHGHEHCEFFRMPKSRVAWWTAKIEGNRARDRRTESALRDAGWHVVTIWECAVNTAAAREWLWQRLPGLISGSGGRKKPTLKVAEDVAPYRLPDKRP